MIAMALLHLCFGGDSPLVYANNKVLLIFFLPQLHYQAKCNSTKQDYNLEGFFPIDFQIYGFESLIP